MKKHLRTALFVVVLLISTTFMLFGCIKPKQTPTLNYPFMTEGLIEQSLKKWEDNRILSRFFANYLENIIFTDADRIEYSSETEITVLEKNYFIELNVNLAKLENGELNIKDPNDYAGLKFRQEGETTFNELGLKEGMLFANVWVDGVMKEYAASLEDIPSFGALLPGTIENSLYTLLGYMSFVTENSRYGKKSTDGVETTELLMCADFYSSLRALLRLMVSKSGIDYGNQAKLKLQESLNELSEFLFGVPYEGLGDLPTVYLNIGMIMKDGEADQLKINVSPNAMYGKPKQ